MKSKTINFYSCVEPFESEKFPTSFVACGQKYKCHCGQEKG